MLLTCTCFNLRRSTWMQSGRELGHRARHLPARLLVLGHLAGWLGRSRLRAEALEALVQRPLRRGRALRAGVARGLRLRGRRHVVAHQHAALRLPQLQRQERDRFYGLRRRAHNRNTEGLARDGRPQEARDAVEGGADELRVLEEARRHLAGGPPLAQQGQPPLLPLHADPLVPALHQQLQPHQGVRQGEHVDGRRPRRYLGALPRRQLPVVVVELDAAGLRRYLRLPADREGHHLPEHCDLAAYRQHLALQPAQLVPDSEALLPDDLRVEGEGLLDLPV
mmetsp:Transcript_104967/g.296966  ORF Transcript_104967/g.296966 Transcript_104967/m.296966 type:complete len:280 (+) Transcript_104967:70-909(+)